MNSETLDILTRWTERTNFLLRRQREVLGVNNDGPLSKSQKYKVRQLSDSMLESQTEFLVRGRFVDMGAGRRSTKIETRDGNGRLLKGKVRRPKKWYSKTFWGRLNDLQGALGYRLMEDAINSVKNQLDDKESGQL
jgi:hypothetical protein